jgi:predicted ATPase
VGLAHWYLGLVQFSLGEYTAARTHLEQVISFYKPEQHHRSFVFLRGSDAGLGALAYDACCLWCLGYPEQASKRSQGALALARELDHPFSLADVLCYGGCLLTEMRRDALALKIHAEELMRLASEKVPVWSPPGQRYWGGALAMLGQVHEGIAQMREGMEASQFIGAWCDLSETLCCLAQAQAWAGQPEEGLATLSEALAFVEQTDQRHSEAELYRVRAELLLMQGQDAEAEAEASLHKAIEVARRQSAKSWELRATTSLARLWHTQGRTDEAYWMLEEVYGWFTEGFDTADLKEARALLEELSYWSSPKKVDSGDSGTVSGIVASIQGQIGDSPLHHPLATVPASLRLRTATPRPLPPHTWRTQCPWSAAREGLAPRRLAGRGRYLVEQCDWRLVTARPGTAA